MRHMDLIFDVPAVRIHSQTTCSQTLETMRLRDILGTFEIREPNLFDLDNTHCQSGQHLLFKRALLFDADLDIASAMHRISVQGGMVYDSNSEMIILSYPICLSKRISRSSYEVEFMIQGM